MKKKLTQKEMAEAAGIKQSTLSLLIAGKRTTSIVKAALMAGKITGRPGIEFICPKRKDIYLKAYPRLAGKKENV